MSQPALGLAAVPTVLRFEADTHQYFLDPEGVELPSVTQVLQRSGFIDFSHVPYQVLESARRRGTAVHQALHYLDDGDLDENTLEPEIHPYVMAYLRFKRDAGFEPELVEFRAHSIAHRYAGTLDRTGTLPTKDGGRRGVLLDFKSGSVLPAHRLQLAAYAGLLPHAQSLARIALELHDDSSYAVHEFPMEEYQRDYAVFTAAVAGEWWKRNYAI